MRRQERNERQLKMRREKKKGRQKRGNRKREEAFATETIEPR